jgi:predicted RNA-binding protein with TRAM domain
MMVQIMMMVVAGGSDGDSVIVGMVVVISDVNKDEDMQLAVETIIRVREKTCIDSLLKYKHTRNVWYPK